MSMKVKIINKVVNEIVNEVLNNAKNIKKKYEWKEIEQILDDNMFDIVVKKIHKIFPDSKLSYITPNDIKDINDDFALQSRLLSKERKNMLRFFGLQCLPL